MNADDFGLSKGVNRGIRDCFQRGILRSTSLMPNGDAFEDAVEIARQNPGLGVGIHLSLVGERCVAPRAEVAGLADSDGFLPASYLAFVRGYLTRRFTQREIEREIEAQMQRALGSGLHFTHLDSHQHVHLLPAVFDLALAAARAAGIAVVRVPQEQQHPVGVSLARAAQLRVLYSLCRRAKRRARTAGLHVAPHFFGLGVSGAMDESTLLAVLRGVRPGVNEIMTHPGYSDATLQHKYQWGYAWDAEAAALQAQDVRAFIDERHIRLSHFGGAW